MNSSRNIETYKFILHNAVNRKTESGRVLGENHRIPAIKAVTINGLTNTLRKIQKNL